MSDDGSGVGATLTSYKRGFQDREKAEQKFYRCLAEGGGENGCTFPITQTPLHASGFQTVVFTGFHTFLYEGVNFL